MDYLPDWAKTLKFADIADFLSVIGFGLTVYVWFTIRKIKSYYIFKVRVPDLLKDMSQQASALARFHSAFENSKPDILLEIGKAEVTLRSLRSKVDRQIKTSIKEVTKQINDYKTYQEKGRAWNIYVSLQKVSQEIINLQKDRRAGDK